MNDNMQVTEGICGKGVPEVGDQFGVEVADFVRGKIGLEDKIRPAAEIQGGGAERLFHR